MLYVVGHYIRRVHLLCSSFILTSFGVRAHGVAYTIHFTCHLVSTFSSLSLRYLFKVLSTDIESASPVNMTLESKGLQRSMYKDKDTKSCQDES
jgi:hypothetical protein